MANNGDSVLEMYLFETNSLLGQLDDIMLAAEQADTLSQEDVNEIFRIMHTLKGSAAMMEFEPLMTLSHRIEDLFYLIREGTMSVIPEEDKPKLFNLLFKFIDYFRAQIENIESGKPLSNDIDSFVSVINMVIDKINGVDTKKDENEQESTTVSQTNIVNGYPYTLNIHLDEGCGMENLRAFMIVNDVRECCSDFVTEPEDIDDSSVASIIAKDGFKIHFATVLERENAAKIIEPMGFVKNFEEVDNFAAPKQETVNTEPQPAPEPEVKQEVIHEVKEQPKLEVVKQAQPVSKPKPTPVKENNGGQGHQIKQSLISVNLSKLDQLMAVVGEIVITEAMVTASPDLKGLDGVKLDNFNKSARQLRKLTDELQDISMSLRMVPVSGTFQKMRRIVRDMGQKLGRRARLTIIGEDTEIDKTIVDAISDPIMHIVRNSMDHGIEPDEQMRIAAGKDPEGEIILSAQNTGSEVIIKIEDDGGGVDTDAVLAKAIRQGLANPDAEYSKREILNFLMMPGFSTNTEVTEFSGRGVGMDVVKKNVEAVSGVVLMTSEFGKGSCTTLKIPLTTAIMDGMEVSVGDSIFTIPIQNIRQSFKATDEDIIHDAMKGEMICKMDNFYPVVRLHERYGLMPRAEKTEDGIFVWVETSENSYCLFVDELLGEQQVVIKPLPSYLNTFGIKEAGIVGCTILGDGNISLILDVSNLISSDTGYSMF
ncbi:MAG TPA: chemotaxis protein CheA [Candidatus Butyricicoccus avistercoris]|uniref:Chemotaxis protein CheA n=1 Tax=Candidatus Butyricicoccus avistercoris TaxID=2838518 RepID=A0A9D1THJ0_9FIRM|nr:chemotaxis protein CheA [Candidatus Butyricicoccus avistercoris]